MLGQLLPCGGGDSIPLLGPKLLVGRAAGVDVPVLSGTVSSKHCLLELRDGYWHVLDLGSKNGTKIDGQRCQSGRLLPNSVLSIAQHRFEVVYFAGGEGPSSVAALQSITKRPERNVVAESDESVRKSAARIQRESLGELIPQAGGETIPLVGPKLVVGRAPGCDVVLPFATVSSRHCLLEHVEGYWHVRDLASRNGIKVGGECCQHRCLRPGDVLSIARFRFEILYAPHGDPPPLEEIDLRVGLLEKAGLAGRADQEPPKQRSPEDE